MNDDREKEEIPVQEQIERMIFHRGWSRFLTTESAGETVVRIRIQLEEGSLQGDYSETDIVGLYSRSDIETDKVTLKMIQYDCRRFLLDRGLIGR